MRRTGLLWLAAIIIAGGCSKTEGTKTPAAEQPAWTAYLERSQASAQAD